MGSFGERMRREREMRGITLEEIAESTKIGTRSLQALEAEDFDKLPGGIFNKGCVRAYSKYLGIDEEQAVTDFGAALDEFQKQVPGEAPLPATADEPEPPSLNLLIAIVAVLVLALGLGIWMLHAPIAAAGRKVFHRVKGKASQSEPTVAAAPKPQPITTPASVTAAPVANTMTPDATPAPPDTSSKA